MTLWLSLAVVAYLLTAVAFIVDKYLLASPIPKPFVYAFWVAILSTPVLFLIPFFDIYIPGVFLFSVAFISGAAFFGGLILLYTSIKKSDVSVASTQVGALTAVFTYTFSFFLLKESLPLNNTLALILLASGMLFLGRVNKKIVLHALGAGALLALSFVLLKWTFTNSDFINGVFWTRIGLIGSALLALIPNKTREQIKKSTSTTPKSSKAIFVGNKLLAGTAFFLLYYAILLGNVVVINALLGLQFVFVFIIALLLKNKLPGIKENLQKDVLLNKIIGITLILIGFLAIII